MYYIRAMFQAKTPNTDTFYAVSVYVNGMLGTSNSRLISNMCIYGCLLTKLV